MKGNTIERDAKPRQLLEWNKLQQQASKQSRKRFQHKRFASFEVLMHSSQVYIERHACLHAFCSQAVFVFFLQPCQQ